MKRSMFRAGLCGAVLVLGAAAVVSYRRHRKSLDGRYETMKFMKDASDEDAATYKDVIIRNALLVAALELCPSDRELGDELTPSDFDLSEDEMDAAVAAMREHCRYDGMGGWDVHAAHLYATAKDLLDGMFDRTFTAPTSGAAELTQEEADRITDEFFSFKQGEGEQGDDVPADVKHLLGIDAGAKG